MPVLQGTAQFGGLGGLSFPPSYPFVDRVKETTTTTGTGNITLLGSVAGYQSFYYGYGLNVEFQYCIEATIGSGGLPSGQWEVGLGHLTGATTLVRDVVLASSNGGALVSFAAGTSNVFAVHGGPTESSCISQPLGRLTLASATPVMTSTISGATTVYFTPFRGAVCPISLDGVNFMMIPFSELSQATTDATKSPAAVAASSVYDIFVWMDVGGTLRATRGPVWSSTTVRGTGPGSTELTLVRGFYVNKYAITNGPIAQCGTFVGSIGSNGASTIDWILGGSASGGTAGVLNVWNNYNRINVQAFSADNGAPYTYSSATARQARASAGNQISFLSGLAEDCQQVSLEYQVNSVATQGATAYSIIELDGTNNSTRFVYAQCYAATANITHNWGTVGAQNAPLLGSHFFASVELGDGSTANTYDANNGSILFFSMPM